MATLDKGLLLIGLVLLFGLTQCGTKDISRSFDSTQVNQLLSAGSQKSWDLIARTEDGEDVFGPCLEDNTLTFVNNAAIDSLYVLGRPETCGSTTVVDTLYKANYILDEDAKEVFQNSMTLSEESHQSIDSIQLEELTSSVLKISYTIDGKAVQERYSH